MGHSRKPGVTERFRNQIGGICPAQSRGSYGRIDSGDPDTVTELGDTGGSVGRDDQSSPETGDATSSTQNIKDDSQLRLRHAKALVEDLIRQGNLLGMGHAASLMRYWRDGGDDLAGSSRSDALWKDMHGEKKQGKNDVDENIFWPGQRDSLPGKLDGHRKKFIAGAATRLRDKRLKAPDWEVEMKWTAASGNWGPSDLQFALGPCSLNSIVKVRAVSRTRAGTTVSLDDSSTKAGDRFTLSFTQWEVFLSDRYDWQHGRSGAAGFMPLMNFHHFLMYGSFKNPQEILNAMESPYGFGNPNFPRVFARPFDVETKHVTLRTPSSPTLDLEKFGAQEFAVPYASLMRTFDVTV